MNGWLEWMETLLINSIQCTGFQKSNLKRVLTLNPQFLIVHCSGWSSFQYLQRQTGSLSLSLSLGQWTFSFPFHRQDSPSFDRAVFLPPSLPFFFFPIPNFWSIARSKSTFSYRRRKSEKEKGRKSKVEFSFASFNFVVEDRREEKEGRGCRVRSRGGGVSRSTGNIAPGVGC